MGFSKGYESEYKKTLHLWLGNMDMSNCDLCISPVLILLWISWYNLWQVADYSVYAGC